MFLGHALIGFAIGGSVGLVAGWDRERALALGLATGAFGAIPDIDMLYALVGVWGAVLNAAGAFGIADAFWGTGNLVHRSVTHSLLVALPIAAAAGLWARRCETGSSRRIRSTVIALGVLATTILVVTAISGLVAGTIVAVFGLSAVGITEMARRRTSLGPTAIVGAAVVGLVTHPFGDVFTGEPPALLYPLDVVLVSERIVLDADPTLHLLAAFGIELTAIWLGIGVLLQLSERSLPVTLAPRAILGAGYAAGALVVPAPTLDVSYPFVFSVLAVGLLGITPRIRTGATPGRPWIRLPDRAGAAITGLAAVTVAWAAYAVAYLLL